MLVLNGLMGFGSPGVNRGKVNLVISSNTQDYDVWTEVGTAGGYIAGLTDITITIDSGVVVGSTSTGTPSLTVNGSFTTGDTVSITNNGTISGKGGAGGGTHSNGAAAGDGISLAFATTIDNQGDLAGGGGGGGGQRRKGAVTSGKDCGETKTGKGGTGGGGAGDDVGTGGGSPTLTVGGTGNNGSKGGGCAPKGGTGGGGGGRGRAGSSGSTGSYGSCTCNRSSNGAGSGGAAGDYITGNSYATWDNTGNVYGGVT